MSSSTIDHGPPALQPDDSHERIVQVEAGQRMAAVQRLLARRSSASRVQAERFLQFSEANRISLEHMWATIDGSARVLDTVLAVANKGRTAILFASSMTHERYLGRLARLVRHACDALDPGAVHLVQVLLEPSEGLQQRAFTAAGLETLANLSFLERPLPIRDLATPELPAGVTVEAYQPAIQYDFLEALDQSYIDTLDCPGLRGLRETSDILEGHRATGAFEASLWTLMRVAGRPAGVLLLNPAPASEAIELVYIGIAPFARRRGLGRKLLQSGLDRIKTRSERAVSLAVDDENKPALRLYEAHRFRRVFRRIAMIRSIRDLT